MKVKEIFKTMTLPTEKWDKGDGMEYMVAIESLSSLRKKDPKRAERLDKVIEKKLKRQKSFK